MLNPSLWGEFLTSLSLTFSATKGVRIHAGSGGLCKVPGTSQTLDKGQLLPLMTGLRVIPARAFSLLLPW